MKPNGKGITQQELELLPEVNTVLWQDDDGPQTIVDSNNQTWFIGIQKAGGPLCKRKLR